MPEPGEIDNVSRPTMTVYSKKGASRLAAELAAGSAIVNSTLPIQFPYLPKGIAVLAPPKRIAQCFKMGLVRNRVGTAVPDEKR
jgi:hypothetical protein